MTQNTLSDRKDTRANNQFINRTTVGQNVAIADVTASSTGLDSKLLADEVLVADGEFLAILGGIESVEDLCKVSKKLSKLSGIDPKVKTQRLEQIRLRIKVLEHQAEFKPFQEGYKEYLGKFTWEEENIVAYITTPDKKNIRERTLKYTALNASIYFRQWVNSVCPKKSHKEETAVVLAEPDLPKPLSPVEKMWLVLNKLVPGQEVIYKNKRGKFTEIHEALLPMAWVNFNNGTPVAVNPLELSLFSYQSFEVGQRCDSDTGIVEIEAIKFYIEEETYLPYLLESTGVTRLGSWKELSILEEIITESTIDFVNTADFSEVEQKAVLYLLNLEAPILDIKLADYLGLDLFPMKNLHLGRLLEEEVILVSDEDEYSIPIELHSPILERLRFTHPLERWKYGWEKGQIVAINSTAPDSLREWGKGAIVTIQSAQGKLGEIQILTLAKSETDTMTGYGNWVELPDNPWDRYPQNWVSGGIECVYDGNQLSWGAVSFAISTDLKDKYINPRRFVNFLQESWEDIEKLVDLFSESDTPITPTPELLNIKTASLRQALKIGLLLGKFCKNEAEEYSLILQTSAQKLAPSDCWNKKDFEGEAPRAIEPKGQASVFFDTSFERPDPDDFASHDEYLAVDQQWLDAETLTLGYPDLEAVRSLVNHARSEHESSPPRSAGRKALAAKLKDALQLQENMFEQTSKMFALEAKASPDAVMHTKLVNISVGDINCSNAMVRATIEQLEYALACLQQPFHPGNQNTRIKAIESKLRRLHSQEGQGEGQGDEGTRKIGEDLPHIPTPPSPPPPHSPLTSLLPDYQPGSNLNLEQSHKLVEAIRRAFTRINAIEQVIAKKLNILRVYIHTLDAGKGYELLNFKNITKLFQSGILGEHSRSKLQKEWQAARVEKEALGLEVGTLPQDHGQKLFKLIKTPDVLKQVYEDALTTAGSRKLTGKLIADSITKITGRTTKKRTKSGWRNDQGPRHYELNLSGYERNFHDTYQDTFVKLERFCQENNRSIEELTVEAMAKKLSAIEGKSEQSAIASAIVELLSSQGVAFEQAA